MPARNLPAQLSDQLHTSQDSSAVLHESLAPPPASDKARLASTTAEAMSPPARSPEDALFVDGAVGSGEHSLIHGLVSFFVTAPGKILVRCCGGLLGRERLDSLASALNVHTCKARIECLFGRHQ